MKRLILTLIAALTFSFAMAQQNMEFPFQGGNKVMMDYFTNNFAPTDFIKYKAASGTVVMKFTADDKGNIIKMVVYYADDAGLAEPVINMLKGTNGKWIIPAKTKSYDFLIPFTINIDAPGNRAARPMLAFYNSRAPIAAADQIPLNVVSLLPAVQLKYTYTPPAPAPKADKVAATTVAKVDSTVKKNATPAKPAVKKAVVTKKPATVQ